MIRVQTIFPRPQFNNFSRATVPLTEGHDMKKASAPPQIGYFSDSLCWLIFAGNERDRGAGEGGPEEDEGREGQEEEGGGGDGTAEQEEDESLGRPASRTILVYKTLFAGDSEQANAVAGGFEQPLVTIDTIYLVVMIFTKRWLNNNRRRFSM